MELVFGIPPEFLGTVFPFHLVMDRDLVILQAGPSITRICGELVGVSFGERFQVIRPRVEARFERIAGQHRAVFLLSHGDGTLQLKGQMLPLPAQDSLLFLGSPFVQYIEEVHTLGLTVRDFAIHDPAGDFLFLLQARNAALDDAERLQESLREQSEQLQRANRKLRAQHELTTALAEASDLKSAAHATLSTIAGTLDARVGVLWVANERQGRFACLHVWHQDDRMLPVARQIWLALRRITDGTVGEARRTGAAVTRLLDEQELGAALAGAANVAGLKRVHAWPVMVHGRVDAVLELFGTSEQPPPEDIHTLTSLLVAKVGEFAERKRAISELHAREQLLRAMTSCSPLGFIVVQSGTEETLFFNDRFLEIWGVEPGVFARMPGLRQTVAGALHRLADPDTFLPRWLAFLEADDRKPTEMEIPFSDGRSVRLYSAQVRDDEDEYIGRLFMFEDITEHKLNAARLAKARDEALEASRMKSAFVATMSHEIRTPLNGVIGMTDILRRTELSAEQQEYVETIRTCSGSLMHIINDVLDFSKIEAGQMVLESELFNLRDTVDEVLEMFGGATANRGIEFGAFVDPSLPAQVRGAPYRLRQVLVNLVGNAIKFTDEGSVFISVEQVGQRPDGVLARFAIRDTGIGISSESSKKLFEPFLQVDGSWARRHGGTGLGLSICKRLVEMMGGSIELDSTHGRGSTFHFKLPFEAERAPAALPDWTLRGRKILCIEDNADHQLAFEAQLEAWGMVVDTASTGAEALGCLQAVTGGEPPWDLVLLDLHLPDLPAATVLEALRRQPGGRQLHVIALSSRSDRSDLPTEAADPALSILSKPVRLSALHALLKSRWQAPAGATNTDSPGPEVETESRRVLLVEDDPVNRRVATLMLDRLGYHYDIAVDGEQAVEIFRSGRYDAVLMDCQLPGMDGLEATRRIRAGEPEGFRVPIIALTANAMREDVERCKAAGMDDHASKPIRLESLRTALEHAARLQAEQQAARRTLQTPPDPTIQEHAPRVLVVDDDALHRRGLRRTLLDLGCETEEASGGAEALQVMAERPCDVVIMDLVMPEMDGFAATTALRETEPPRQPLIIAITARISDDTAERAKAAGVDVLLPKPIDRAALVGALRSAPALPSSASMPANEDRGPILDTQVISDLQGLSDGDTSFLGELLDTFAAQCPLALDELRLALATSSADGLARAAHRCKSSSGYLGAFRVARTAERIEAIGRSGTTEGAQHLVEALATEFVEARQALEKAFAAK